MTSALTPVQSATGDGIPGAGMLEGVLTTVSLFFLLCGLGIRRRWIALHWELVMLAHCDPGVLPQITVS